MIKKLDEIETKEKPIKVERVLLTGRVSSIEPQGENVKVVRIYQNPLNQTEITFEEITAPRYAEGMFAGQVSKEIAYLANGRLYWLLEKIDERGSSKMCLVDVTNNGKRLDNFSIKNAPCKLSDKR